MTLNQRISKSVSNFFHKSQTGRAFDRILKVPFFAISTENVGIQMADIVGHIMGRRFTGDRNITAEFFQRAKSMQYESKDSSFMRGIKVVREKAAPPKVSDGNEL